MTAKLMSRLQVLVAIAFAVVALLATRVEATTVYVVDESYNFGSFDLDGPNAFQYQLIQEEPANGQLNNLATDPTGGFYTFNYDYSQVGRISTAGNYTAIGTAGVELTGLSMAPSGTLYAYDFSSQELVTVDTSSGSVTSVGPSGWDLDSQTGMLAFLGSNLYGVSFVNDEYLFFSVDTTTGAFTQVGPSNNMLFNTVLFSSGNTLYGINQSDEIFTINTATGVPTKIGDMTGTLDYFTGAAVAASPPAPVPEIDPAGMGSVLALMTGAIGLLEQRRRRPVA